ncbi:DUF1800 domain-containing protein [Corallococcus macrosporus]|uniref:DUF1800 domain-containing protein n=1 Tax=Corallococcus macrosporus DSM 14697 TaxID=1189310 RepID=A0A250JZZ5_9BACT|nr:DUF1800 family protein [Corallococcus macrosporus]ATB49424.1 hypothetical protein MYMAC_005068 [Corallococcus macrosporus DSM 14697]
MLRRLTLAMAVCVTACAPEDSPPEAVESEVLGQREQAAEPLETPSEANAIRFLEQSTFGPKLAWGASPLPIDTVESVMARGISASITAQLNAARSTYTGELGAPDLGSQFFTHAIEGRDQLRQRVSFALSQLFVVSQNGIPNLASTPESEPRLAMAGYLNTLSANAFGNFRDLLEAITLNPAMGTYLDMANNKAYLANGTAVAPNENYAREMLQLFTLGLHKLNEDGTERTDAEGAPIPAYTEAHVQAFAHALSGWTYANENGCPDRGRSNPASYGQRMIGCNVNHDSSSQLLLRGQRTTAGGGVKAHLNEALDNVFADPNLPPFICKQLIQHLVTSNPRPGYVRRVVNVFKDNGSGVRGDLGAVVRAILEDDDARGPSVLPGQRANYGHLRSPALFVTTLVRWLNGTLDTAGGTKDPGAKLNSWSSAMGQSVPRPPSVFSYYPPNAPAPGGNGLLGPEFAILDTATVTARANFVHELLYANTPANAGVMVDVSVLPADASALVVWLGRYWLHASMSSSLQTLVHGAITDARAGDSTRQRKLAVYLTSLSPEFQIQR